MLKISSIIFFILLLITSCGESYGDRIKVEELEVYYLAPGDSTLAHQVALYFIDEGLASGERQSLQLSRGGGGYVLKMILNDPKQNKLTQEEIDLLNWHEKLIGNTIFEGAKLEIELADPHFETVIKTNED